MQTKEFGAKIPEELYEEFRFLFPQYGATTWFIETSLREFIEVVRENATLQEMVSKSIDQMLDNKREKRNDEAQNSDGVTTGVQEGD